MHHDETESRRLGILSITDDNDASGAARLMAGDDDLMTDIT